MNRIKVTLLSVITIITLTGCSAGLANMYEGEISANQQALANLGPESEDTPDEARRRKIHEANIAEAKQKLGEVN
ncbi:hypothetical protein L0668_20475 [Paraglaciecola aquimarina]|uniref:Lipoprotein n=1 Tax=Paraglaciecola algarum TaxID=3050085 RepID=A0ABS9DCC0_9ALTE|nr:hypothetical protein [Paraglaciecola sp. G1-23]MCF2950496.1 hypothetical protein [Paraglaciecola sp. G1-23]